MNEIKVADVIEADSPIQSAGRFQPGNTFSQGRRRGSLNKSSAELKAAIIAALDEAGGVQWLKSLATSTNPDDKRLFVALLIRCLPSQTAADTASSNSEVTVTWTAALD